MAMALESEPVLPAQALELAQGLALVKASALAPESADLVVALDLLVEDSPQSDLPDLLSCR
ncbi:hypothetical protein [Bdellovibrio bacteriovorus]|uniref:hypothetical protein n=1 Tax=Bdellovibrio bacteriovorus TaxID=959 RepID=UPI0035A588B4